MTKSHSLCLAVCMFLLSANMSSQLTGLTVETVTVHDGSIPELAGYTTYRVYADLTSEFDFVSAVYGDADTPLLIGCDDGGASTNLHPGDNRLTLATKSTRHSFPLSLTSHSIPGLPLEERIPTRPMRWIPLEMNSSMAWDCSTKEMDFWWTTHLVARGSTYSTAAVPQILRRVLTATLHSQETKTACCWRSSRPTARCTAS